MIARPAFALLGFLLSVQVADAAILSCLPVRTTGEGKLEVYLDANTDEMYPPKKIGEIRVLTRFGADVYEFFPDQTKELRLRGDMLTIHLQQPLSAGQSAEMRLEGRMSAKKSEPFAMKVTFRNERRSGQGEVQCMFD